MNGKEKGGFWDGFGNTGSIGIMRRVSVSGAFFV
jgi:hypothetical protein